MRPKIYSPEAVEAGQSFWSAVIVFDCCMVVCPVPILVSWSVGFATVDAKAGSLIIDDSAILGSIVTLKSGVEGIEIFSRQNRPFSLTNRIHWSAEGIGKAPNASGNYYSFRRSVRSDPVASRDFDGPVRSLLGRHRDRKDIIGRRLGGRRNSGVSAARRLSDRRPGPTVADGNPSKRSGPRQLRVYPPVRPLELALTPCPRALVLHHDFRGNQLIHLRLAETAFEQDFDAVFA